MFPENSYQEKLLDLIPDLERIEELKKGFDRTGEISQEVLSKINFSNLTNKISEIVTSDVFLVTVPTPIDDFKKPDLTALKNACITIGKALKIRFQNAVKTQNKKIPVIIFESTVYPGTTEEICIPIIKKELNDSLKLKKNKNLLFMDTVLKELILVTKNIH